MERGEKDMSIDGAGNQPVVVQTPVGSLYSKLAAEFDQTFSDRRGGVDLTYITGEQVTTRLNEALGFLQWSFEVVEHGIHPEADEIWVLGKLTVYIEAVRADGVGAVREVYRSQFGSQKIKRSRSTGTPLDIGFDLKGAGTDALKKCASLIGVGLYLSQKEPQASQAPRSATVAPNSSGALLSCEDCGETLTRTTFKSGDVWEPEQLATFGRRKHGKVLCIGHYREASQSARDRDGAAMGVPF